MANPEDYLVRHKSDIENAQQLVALGYPAVRSVLPQMMEWIQDMNWPVARVLQPFLVSIGEPILPEVRRVFESDDLVWQYWCIVEILGHLPVENVSSFRPELERLALRPTQTERQEELDQVAGELLAQLDE
ncbi:MAG: DUF5071 domain-containing protein [Planctomycetota bacterium]